MLLRTLFVAALAAGCGGTTTGGPDGSTDAQTSSDVTTTDGSTPNDAAPDVTTPTDAGAQDAAPGTYSARQYSGGLDHMFVYKADPQRKLCFGIALAAPQTNTSGITLPPQWGVQTAMAFDSDQACVFPYTGDASVAYSSGQSGSMDWPDSGFQIPSTITSIAVTLDFDAGPSWVPTSEVLSASNVPVQ